MTEGSNAPVRISAKLIWPFLAVFFLALNLKNYATGDLWFLLLAGRYVLETGHVPHHEFFMYTAAGMPDVFGGWGYGLILELAKRFFGIPSMYILNAALWSGVFLTGFVALRVRLNKALMAGFSLPELAGILLASFIVYGSVANRTMMRPEVTMYLIWGLGVLLFELARRRGSYHRAQIIFPLLIWAEAWLHTAGIVLLLIPAAYMVEDCAERLLVRKEPVSCLFLPLLCWGGCLLACLVLPVLNPNGAAQIYLHLINRLNLANPALMQPVLALAGMKDMPFEHLIALDRITEFAPVWGMPVTISGFQILSGVTAAVLITGERRLHGLVSIVPLAILGTMHMRGLSLWALALLVPLAALSVNINSQICRYVATRRCNLGMAAVCLFCLIVLGSVAYLYNGLRWPENRLPLPEGTQAIRQAYPQGGNIFASYVACAPVAYAMGGKYAVPLGAHMMFMWPETLNHHEAVLKTKQGWELQMEQYDVIAAVTEMFYLDSGTVIPLSSRLAASAEWRLAAIEEEGITFIKLAEHEKALTPAERLVKSKRYWQAVADAVEKQGENPAEDFRQTGIHARTMLSLIGLYESAPDQALDVLEKYANDKRPVDHE